MRKTTLVAAIAAGVIALTAGCATGPVAEGSDPTTSTTKAGRYLPDDTAEADRETQATRRVPTTAEMQEQAFMDATCDMLDEGYTLDSVMLGAVMVDKPFSDERAGELIVEAIVEQCPVHTQELRDLIAEEGH